MLSISPPHRHLRHQPYSSSSKVEPKPALKPLIKQESELPEHEAPDFEVPEFDDPDLEPFEPVESRSSAESNKKYPWSLYPGGHDKYMSADALAPGRGWADTGTLFCGDRRNPAYIYRVRLRDALKPPRKSGKNLIFRKSLVELHKKFNEQRDLKALYGRLRCLCQTYLNIQIINQATGGSIDLSCPELELIHHLNAQIDVIRPHHDSLKYFGAWRYTAFVTGVGENTWFNRLHQIGRISPRGAAFWRGEDECAQPGASAKPAATKAKPAKVKGRVDSASKYQLSVDTIGEGSESSLPSAPSTRPSESSSQSFASSPATNSCASGRVVPRQPAPLRATGRRASTMGEQSTAESRATHSPEDPSQASRIELIREGRAAGVQGVNSNLWLIQREQDMLLDLRGKGHELKARRVELEEAEMQARIHSERQKNHRDFLLQLRASGPQGDTDNLMAGTVNTMIVASLEASAQGAPFAPPTPAAVPRPATAASLAVTPSTVAPARSANKVRPNSSTYFERLPDSAYYSQPVHPKREMSQTPGAGPSMGRKSSRSELVRQPTDRNTTCIHATNPSAD
ncbi:hypothetical protein FRC08_014423 [Ceratobasidium sp. 394]|nr:hypothetical protein FRC08_014423 [Ceratobasidium sp. 394]KAG9102108.1 hypothetical protein FS749_015691 [Ceratobasidium sp. UAMH 11750]